GRTYGITYRYCYSHHRFTGVYIYYIKGAEEKRVLKLKDAGMIDVNNISYSVGHKKLLDGVTFQVKPGELMAVIGANGAGKSTLMKLLCKEIICSAGSVRIRHKDILGYPLEELAR